MDRRAAQKVGTALALLLCLVSCAAGEIKHKTGFQNKLYEIRLPKRCAFVVQQPLGLDVRSFNVDEEDYKQVLVLFSHKHKQIVITTFSNGEVIPDVTQYVIKLKPAPGPDPGPGPDPDPDPDPDTPIGFPKKVFDQAIAVKMKREDAGKIADNFEGVASAVAAGGIKTREEANQKLYQANGVQPKTYKPFFDFLEKWLTDNNVKTKEQMVASFNGIAEGLRHVR